ncbi:hypothetical protein [Legionella tunisiensis]|uniref:hypothetical protein n=1 Tax=Legionella tunisiensis TaxID=1034944 RepID=UPI00031CA7FE|nr:hypothetical protein [Legionella tunisiensis]
MKGIITSHRGSPDPNAYNIRGDDGQDYFAHIGDLKKNENLLYHTSHEILSDGDRVEFDVPNTKNHVYHVRKIEQAQ